jgi:hypothetical protein
MGLNSVTCGILNWGTEYWARFSKTMLESLAACDPQPDRIIIATDRPLDDLPDNVEQIESNQRWAGWNLIAAHTDTTWLFNMGLDDTLPGDAFAGIEADEDCIGFACQQSGETNAIARPPHPDEYRVAWRLDHNPMNGGYIYRCSSVLQVPFREYIYADEVFFAEWSYFGLTYRQTDKIRLNWFRWSGSNSWPANRAGEQQAREFKHRLREGKILKGIPE